jgi:hypothetical protein
MTKEEADRLLALPEAQFEQYVRDTADAQILMARGPDRAPLTSEQDRSAVQSIVRNSIHAIAGQPWVEQYLAAPIDWTDPELIEWVRSRPESVKKLIRDFPPGCLVKSAPGYEHRIPAKGTVGGVIGFLESGNLIVVQGPEARVKVYVPPHEVELAATVSRRVRWTCAERSGSCRDGARRVRRPRARMPLGGGLARA